MSYQQSTTLPATDPQKSYLRKLAAERLAASMGATSTERVARVNTWVANGLTKRQASQSISWLQSMPMDAAPVVKDVESKTVDSALTPGVYDVDGHIYVVKPNKAKTRLYAKRLVETRNERYTEGGYLLKIDFVYEAGAIFNIKPQHRMPIERAEALTIRYGHCIVCGRALRAGQSVKRGIGPVCRKLFA